MTEFKFVSLFEIKLSYEFGTTWGWIIQETIFIFGWTILLSWGTKITKNIKKKYLPPKKLQIDNKFAKTWKNENCT